jgi:carbon-monoxide dehydrogenase small subunit
MENTFNLSLTVNGTSYQKEIDPRTLLSDFLRHDLSLTGTHVGCEHGVCGACTILLDGATTVEGLGTIDNLHPIQEAFREAHALQCGFCTPGFLTTLVPYLEENPDPSEDEIREAISGNLCRCTGYQHIIDAVKIASESMNS